MPVDKATRQLVLYQANGDVPAAIQQKYIFLYCLLTWYFAVYLYAALGVPVCTPVNCSSSSQVGTQ